MFKLSYKILKNNMIFIQPFLLWQIAFTMVIVFSMERVQMFIPRVTLWGSMFLLFTACLAGWLYINKYAVLSYDEKDTPEQITAKTIQNFKKFFEGVGSDFVRTLLALILIICLYSAAFYCIYKFGKIYYGIPDFVNNISQFAQTASEKEQLMQFVNNISDSDKIIFSKWVFTVNLVLSVLNFFSILYLTVMSFERKNFIISLFSALKFFLMNLFEAIGIMIFVFLLYVLINILSVFLGANSFLFAILIIILTLYLNYYILLLFCFYYGKTKNHSNNGGKLVGEDGFSDTTGKEA